jgi:hypothetical protein
VSGLTVVTWVWRGERAYDLSHAAALATTIRRHYPHPLRFVAISDEPRPVVDTIEVMQTPPAARELASLKTPEKANFPSSYRRLWLFSEEAARLFPGRVLLTDVDAVATGNWAPLLNVAGNPDFVGWKPRQKWGGEGRVAGGMWLLRTGTRTGVYEDFVVNPARAIEAARAAGFRGSDQAWLSYKLAATAPVWAAGSGVYSVRDFLERDANGRPVRHGTIQRTTLPSDARVVHFNGHVKPWHAEARRLHPWLSEHWPP